VVGKDEWVKLRISLEDKALFSEQAEEEGLSLSAWMRSHLRRIARENQSHHKVLRPVPVKKKRTGTK
jgi:hypothetical protein